MVQVVFTSRFENNTCLTGLPCETSICFHGRCFFNLLEPHLKKKLKQQLTLLEAIKGKRNLSKHHEENYHAIQFEKHPRSLLETNAVL